MLTLREYQVQAIARVRASLRSGNRRVVLVAPTGAGKTIIAGEILIRAVGKGSRVLFLAHRKELIDQPSALLDSLEIEHGIIRASDPRTNPGLPVQVASVQTLVRREYPAADLIIIDECHRARAKTYETILGQYPEAVVLGLTATPWRLDGKGLGQMFDDLVVATTPAALVDQGFLVAPRVYAPHTPDRGDMAIRNGDFTAEALDTYRRSLLVGDIVTHWRKLADGRRTVVFGVSIAHSEEICEAFRADGIAAEHVDGSMGDEQRTAILARLRSGETTVVCNCDIISEGFDLPELSCCVMARPTASSVKYLQQLGRIMRPIEGKADAVVLDHAGNTMTHGFVTDEREYALGSRDPARTPKKTLAVVCEACMSAIPAGVNPCPECGHTRVVERREVKHHGGDLSELEPTGDRWVACRGCGSPTRLQAVSRFQANARCDCGVSTWYPTEAADDATMADKRDEYRRLRGIADRRGYMPGWVAHRYRDVFGVWPRGVSE